MIGLLSTNSPSCEPKQAGDDLAGVETLAGAGDHAAFHHLNHTVRKEFAGMPRSCGWSVLDAPGMLPMPICKVAVGGSNRRCFVPP